VTIRAKLYAAMVMTVLGPLITIGVAFTAFQSLSDRFDEVSARSERHALALELTEPRERALLARLRGSFGDFMALDAVAYRALRAGREGRVRQLFVGPEIRNFEAIATAAGQLADEEARRTAEVQRAFDQRLTDAKKTLVVVGLGAGVLIILLLLTASDIARLALERHASNEP